MLTDPALAELTFVVYAEPDNSVMSVAFAAPDQPVRACPEWVGCELCHGSGVLEAATGDLL